MATNGPQATFQEILRAAIEDMVTHGFDSAERVAFWSKQIKDAAERAAKSQRQMEDMLRQAMAAVYRKQIEKGGIVKLHPGIGRFTLEKVRPALRAELDRRIMASANLIKLNREQSIAKTLQRFEGWSTSIPKGGSDAANKSKLKAEIKKPLASLPFEERRVLTDQSHKLVASLNDILATDGGAIAAKWKHRHVNQPRPEHVARDGHVFLIRGSWAADQGLVKSVDGYADEIEQPAEFVFCRCMYVYLYNLRDLPPEMLTAKGKAALAEARERIKAL